MEPAVDALLDAARDSGDVQAEITGRELLSTVALLCQPVAGDDLSFNQHMVRIFTVENRLDVLVNTAGIYDTGVSTAELTRETALLGGKLRRRY